MSANVEAVRKIYDAFLKGDIQGVLSLLNEDVEWTVPGGAQVPFAGRRNGRSAVAQFFTDIDRGAQVEEFEPREFWGSGGEVFVLGREKIQSKATGRVYETEWIHHWRVQDGKIAFFREYTDTAAVNAAFG
jgi:ketosteroid isomerase-like protein